MFFTLEWIALKELLPSVALQLWALARKCQVWAKVSTLKNTLAIFTKISIKAKKGFRALAPESD